MSDRRFRPINSGLSPFAKAEDVTISGAWTFTGSVVISDGAGTPATLTLDHNGTYGGMKNSDAQGGFNIFDAETVADDATTTRTSPFARNHGIWIVANTWDDSAYGMFAHTSQSVTQLGGGANFQLGDNGTNPDVDGDINCWMSGNSELSIKNRTGGNASIVVYHLGA